MREACRRERRREGEGEGMRERGEVEMSRDCGCCWSADMAACAAPPPPSLPIISVLPEETAAAACTATPCSAGTDASVWSPGSFMLHSITTTCRNAL